MTAGTAETTEVWLRGNPRPAVAGAAVLGLATVAAAAGARAAAWPAWAAWALVAAGGLTAVAVLVVGTLPRLARRGASLRFRLAPLRVHDVPFELVECVFPGSSPLVNGEGTAAPRRVGTVVVRLAERATAWRQRPTLAAWGSWHDGHVVIDGRWCEPLSLETTRQLGQRILEAKREVAAAAAARAGTAP